MCIISFHPHNSLLKEVLFIIFMIQEKNPEDQRDQITCLKQEPANPLCKGTESKYDRFCGSYRLSHKNPAPPLWGRSSHRQYINNENDCVSIRLEYWNWILKLNFLNILHHKIFLFLIFFLQFIKHKVHAELKNCKKQLTSWLWAVGWVCQPQVECNIEVKLRLWTQLSA